MFVDRKDFKIKEEFVELDVKISEKELDDAYNHFADISKTDYCTPEYVRSDKFYGAPWLRFPLRCMYESASNGTDLDNFIINTLKKQPTHDLVSFYQQAIAFYKPYTFKMLDALESHLGHRYYILGTEINMLPPGGEIKPHMDNHYLDYTSHRVHLVLGTNEHAYMFCGMQAKHFEKGKCFIFNNKKLHYVRNSGDTPRTHMVVDFLQYL